MRAVLSDRAWGTTSPLSTSSLLRISPEKHPVDPRKSRSPEAQHSWSPAATFSSIYPSYHPSSISSLPPPTTHATGILGWKVLGSSKGSPGCCPSSGLLSVGDLHPSGAMTLGLGTRIIQFIFLLSFKGQWGTWASGKPPDYPASPATLSQEQGSSVGLSAPCCPEKGQAHAQGPHSFPPITPHQSPAASPPS